MEGQENIFSLHLQQIYNDKLQKEGSTEENDLFQISASVSCDVRMNIIRIKFAAFQSYSFTEEVLHWTYTRCISINFIIIGQTNERPVGP